MPTIKILKDGRELVSISVPDDFEIRVVPTGAVQHVAQPALVAGLAATIPPVPTPASEPAPEPARAEPSAGLSRSVSAGEEKEVGEIMEAALSKVEETSKRLAKAVRYAASGSQGGTESGAGDERKEDIALIRKVIEQLVE